MQSLTLRGVLEFSLRDSEDCLREGIVQRNYPACVFWWPGDALRGVNTTSFILLGLLGRMQGSGSKCPHSGWAVTLRRKS